MSKGTATTRCERDQLPQKKGVDLQKLYPVENFGQLLFPPQNSKIK